ncbi:MAG TPA: ABC transporter permease, partial [bacterium]|nr:ABC transporter permease [bacterium]
VEQCDMTGIGLILELKSLQETSGAQIQINGLRPDYQNIFDLVCQRGNRKVATKAVARLGELESIGRNVESFLKDLYDQIAFVGEVIVQVGRAVLNPRLIRWKDVFLFIEKSGVDAVPIIMMIGFLVGMIIAFQGVIPLRQMGSDVFVAAIVAFAILRELGPLITAIILAGRTGSAIAAEIGTMKVNEEVNALTTMGLEPVRFLVVSRVIGILFLAPLLTIISDFFGMLGGAAVFAIIGHPMTTYVDQVTQAVTLSDVWGGLFKSIPFGLAIAGVGCLRGLQTKTGASAVGDSTTSSVVTGIILIIILDGLISTMYYFLGI